MLLEFLGFDEPPPADRAGLFALHRAYLERVPYEDVAVQLGESGPLDEAERIVKEARERQEQLVSQQEVTRQAERAAEDIIEDARAREREIRLGAEDYADEILNTLEVNLSKFIAAVQRGRDRLAGKDEPAEVS